MFALHSYIQIGTQERCVVMYNVCTTFIHSATWLEHRRDVRWCTMFALHSYILPPDWNTGEICGDVQCLHYIHTFCHLTGTQERCVVMYNVCTTFIHSATWLGHGTLVTCCNIKHCSTLLHYSIWLEHKTLWHVGCTTLYLWYRWKFACCFVPINSVLLNLLSVWILRYRWPNFVCPINVT